MIGRTSAQWKLETVIIHVCVCICVCICVRHGPLFLGRGRSREAPDEPEQLTSFVSDRTTRNLARVTCSSSKTYGPLGYGN